MCAIALPSLEPLNTKSCSTHTAKQVTPSSCPRKTCNKLSVGFAGAPEDDDDDDDEDDDDDDDDDDDNDDDDADEDDDDDDDD